MPGGEHLVLGVDIGGTKVAAGLVNSAGEVLRQARTAMVTTGSAKEGLRAVTDAIDQVLPDGRAAGVFAVGISVPGWVDSRRGVLLSATNLPCWRNYPLPEKIHRHYKLPARVANDANVAALAEAVWGAGASYKNVFYVSLGTGIGTGIVLSKRLYYGRTGTAGEGGHMTIDFSGPRCGCGKRGCIEMYASGTAIAQAARQRLTQSPSARSKMMELAEGKIAAVTAETVGDAALAGDRLAMDILQQAADHLAIWLGNIIDLLEPDVIVVGGGLGHLMTSFLHHIETRLSVWAINPRRQEIPVVNALYRSDSALVGSAALWFSRSKLWLSSWQQGSQAQSARTAKSKAG